MDDIFCLLPRGRNIDEFMLVINNLVPSVTFTFERENNEQCLPFLDVLVHRLERNFLFSIYRKPTKISSYIHNYSEHPENVNVITVCINPLLPIAHKSARIDKISILKLEGSIKKMSL